MERSGEDEVGGQAQHAIEVEEEEEEELDPEQQEKRFQLGLTATKECQEADPKKRNEILDSLDNLVNDLIDAKDPQITTDEQVDELVEECKGQRDQAEGQLFCTMLLRTHRSRE
ncbi:unnamed protein product [Amoebophrya sp. A25]|nr:unnamed protein product [Amoebophrya sp. A25]|eukprot:GSA25T00022816001.1